MTCRSTFFTLVKKKDTEAELYALGIILALITVLLSFIIGIVERFTSIPLTGFCYFRKLTGIYCPGCGATRALHYLFSLRIGKSLFYNPIVIYSGIILAVFYISQTIRFISRDKIKGLKFRMMYVYVGLAILFCNWIWKNYYLIFIHIALID